MYSNDNSKPAILVFTATILGVGLLIMRNRIAKRIPRKFAHGLPFPHMLMSHRGGSLEYVENTMPGQLKLHILNNN